MGSTHGSCSPRSRPPGAPSVTCLTLAVPESPDVALAASLTRRHGMPHRVVTLDAVSELAPLQAHQDSLRAARRIDAASDPLAHAVLERVEDRLGSVPRLSGLGGEVVRGFYYVPAAMRGFTRDHKVARLAAWRLFPNESVPDEVIHETLRERRRPDAVRRLQGIFAGYPREWNAATDRFYLEQRMQRWAGLLASTTSRERVVVNPMLDPEFIGLGTSLPTAWKADMRFLSSILLALRPRAGGHPARRATGTAGLRPAGPAQSGGLRGADGRKVAGKVRQRLSSTGRAAAGDATIADLVVAAWRSDPELVAGARAFDVVDPAWLDGVLAGRPAASSGVGLVLDPGRRGGGPGHTGSLEGQHRAARAQHVRTAPRPQQRRDRAPGLRVPAQPPGQLAGDRQRGSRPRPRAGVAPGVEPDPVDDLHRVGRGRSARTRRRCASRRRPARTGCSKPRSRARRQKSVSSEYRKNDSSQPPRRVVARRGTQQHRSQRPVHDVRPRRTRPRPRDVLARQRRRRSAPGPGLAASVGSRRSERCEPAVGDRHPGRDDARPGRVQRRRRSARTTPGRSRTSGLRIRIGPAVPPSATPRLIPPEYPSFARRDQPAVGRAARTTSRCRRSSRCRPPPRRRGSRPAPRAGVEQPPRSSGAVVGHDDDDDVG